MERKRRTKISRVPVSVDMRIIALEKIPVNKNMDKINLILSVLSETMPAGIPEKAQHKLKVKVTIPTAV